MHEISRRRFLATTALSTGVVAAVRPNGVAGQTSGWFNEPYPRVLERYLAIDNVCAYASLTLAGDGTLLASIRNRPVHSGPDVDIECWASQDGGKFWKLRGIAAPHAQGTSQEQSAIGIAHDGSIVVIARTDKYEGRVRRPLPLRVCRSHDGGRTWEWTNSVKPPTDVYHLTPFGNVVRCPNGVLAAVAFDVRWREEITRKIGHTPDVMPIGEAAEAACYVFFSKNDGRTWGDAALLGAPGAHGRWFGSTSILRLRSGRWLAAVDKWSHVALFASEDEGRTWTERGPLTVGGMRQRPGHLIQLADERVLLTYGLRERDHPGHPNDMPGFVPGTLFRAPLPPGAPIAETDLPARKPYEDEEWYQQYGWGKGMSHGPGCITIRLSTNEGQTWLAPRLVTHLEESTDGSYPASAQLADGSIVTVYHANRTPGHYRFHMGVVRWKLENPNS